MYGWHLRKYSFTLLSFAGFLCPVFGAFFGWIFLSEPITWHHFVSLCLIASGLFLFYRDELKGRWSK
jgi:drug/metabolite transporter (DMT)-like permease